MNVGELRETLASFKAEARVVVVIPQLNQPHEFRNVAEVGHVSHPGEVKTDAGVHLVDVICDPWDSPAEEQAGVESVGALVEALGKWPDEMGVRVTVPLTGHSEHSHRLLDVAMVGFAVGHGPGKGVQIVTENWDNPMAVVRERPEAVESRLSRLGSLNQAATEEPKEAGAEGTANG